MRFFKYQGLGNDFVLVDESQGAVLNEDSIKFLCDRHFGIGGDGVVTVSVSPPRMRIFNADGTRAGICGNALRCVAHYLNKQGMATDGGIKVLTDVGERTLYTEVKEGRFSALVNMGLPDFRSKAVPVAVSSQDYISRALYVGGARLYVTAVNVGNPHVVIHVSEMPSDANFNRLGPLIERHAMFPSKTNVEWVQVLDRHTVNVRVWERGVGETLACGTGATAVAAVVFKLNLCDKYVDVKLRGGTLQVNEETDGLYVRGGAECVFTGEIEL